MTIASKIKKIREIKGFSQEYMANELGITQSTYSRLETDDKNLSIDKLKTISEILEVNAIDFLKSSDEVIFNNCEQSDFYNTYNLPKEYIESLKNRINEQQKEIDYLRKLLDKQLLK